MADTEKGRRGRFRNALAVVFGRRVTPQQLQAEWVEYQVALDSMLSTFGAYLARLAKQRKRELERHAEELAHESEDHRPAPAGGPALKEQLRRIAFQRIGPHPGVRPPAGAPAAAGQRAEARAVPSWEDLRSKGNGSGRADDSPEAEADQ